MEHRPFCLRRWTLRTLAAKDSRMSNLCPVVQLIQCSLLLIWPSRPPLKSHGSALLNHYFPSFLPRGDVSEGLKESLLGSSVVTFIIANRKETNEVHGLRKALGCKIGYLYLFYCLFVVIIATLLFLLFSFSFVYVRLQEECCFCKGGRVV